MGFPSSLSVAQQFAENSFDIPLQTIVRSNGGTIVSDPMFEFYAPPKNSKDRFSTSNKGLRIQQFKDYGPRHPPWYAGFKTLVLMRGDFVVELELDCKIEKPAGWGQGIYIAVAYDDALATEHRLCRHLVERDGDILQIEKTGLRVEEPTYQVVPFEFASGILRIERIGHEVKFSAIQDSETIEIGSLRSPDDAHVRHIELRCTRQSEGNAAADYLLKRLRVSADDFFAVEDDNPQPFNWLYVAIPVQILVIVVAGYFAAKQNS